MIRWLALILLLQSCSSTNTGPGHIPGPSRSVTRSQSIAIAYTYANLPWTPQEKNILHGADRDGIEVQTPDQSLKQFGYARGWWVSGQSHTGMPYQWGGFDTPQSFWKKIARGAAAGDIASPLKRAGGDAVVSKHAAGIDCSGFVSRCWRLPWPYSTAELPRITDEISWGQLLPGDILLNDRHVLLFAGWQKPGSVILAYEAGPYPMWKVSANAIPTEILFAQRYQPRRYHHIINDPSS